MVFYYVNINKHQLITVWFKIHILLPKELINFFKIYFRFVKLKQSVVNASSILSYSYSVLERHFSRLNINKRHHTKKGDYGRSFEEWINLHWQLSQAKKKKKIVVFRKQDAQAHASLTWSGRLSGVQSLKFYLQNFVRLDCAVHQL